jgi:small nuclear ribonucleoprotein (snRNP)-like protein
MFSDGATAITILFILLAAGLAAFIRKRTRDKCLRDFERNMVTLEAKSGKTVWGTLRVENTGLEFVYSEKYKDQQGHEEASYLLYKYEYPNIQAVIRFHDDLSEPDKKEREKELKRTYHPGPWRREKRKILNVFRTVRDSVVEIVNLLISQAKKAAPAGKMLASQDKYVSQMKEELVGAVGTSFEPLLERYIGRRVVLQMIKGDKVIEYSGVLKEYTADFVEVMDVDYAVAEDRPAGKADLVVPRNLGLIRHLGE